MPKKLMTLMVGATVAWAVAPVPAQAATPWVALTCGSVVRSNSYLRADLTCPGPGVSVELTASRSRRATTVLLDLRGHHLRAGSGASGPAVTVAGPGMLSVRNGTIEGWPVGLRTVPGEPGEGLAAKKVTLDRVTWRGNQTAVESSDVPWGRSITPVTIVSSLFTGNGTAIEVRDAGPVRVDRSTFQRNGQVVWADSGAVSVSRSRLEDSQAGAVCRESSCAFTSNTFRGNTLAVSVGIFTDAVLTDNVFTDNSTAYEQSTLTTGRLSRNGFTGNQTAVSMTDSIAQLEDNTFVRNGSAFVLEDVDHDDDNTSLSRNLFRENRDGVYAPDGGATLTSNTAVANTGWGIYAPGSTDGGGNEAYDNGRSPQCVGVAC